MSQDSSTLLTDDDISDFLRNAVKNLREATELLVDPKGQPRRNNFIRQANYLINEFSNELEEYAEKLRVNGNVYKTRHNYMRMLNREQEYKNDEEYFARLRRERTGLETQSQPEETSYPDEREPEDETNG